MPGYLSNSSRAADKFSLALASATYSGGSGMLIAVGHRA